MMLYLLGTLPSMIATGMNPFINAQGYSTTGMFPWQSVQSQTFSWIRSLFYLPSGRKRCSGRHCIVTDFICTVCVSFSAPQSGDQSPPASKNELSSCIPLAKSIISLGTSGFIMQLTNSLVSICCNHVLSVTGGDVYVSVMTIVSSVRQMVETPIYAITEGSSPIISYNYGALRPTRVKKPASRWLLWRSSIPASCGA